MRGAYKVPIVAINARVCQIQSLERRTTQAIQIKLEGISPFITKYMKESFQGIKLHLIKKSKMLFEIYDTFS